MYYCFSTNKKLLVSWQFSGRYDVTKYGSGWKKDVINQYLEFDYHCISITVTSQLHGCAYQSSVIANTLLLSLSIVHVHTHTHMLLSLILFLCFENWSNKTSAKTSDRLLFFPPRYMLILTHLASQSPVTTHSFALPYNSRPPGSGWLADNTY